MTKTEIKQIVNDIQETFKGQTFNHDQKLVLLTSKEISSFIAIQFAVIDTFLDHTDFIIEYHVRETFTGLDIDLFKVWNIESFGTSITELNTLNEVARLLRKQYHESWIESSRKEAE